MAALDGFVDATPTLGARRFTNAGTPDRGGYTVQTPGHLPTYVTPNIGGGYTFQTPGQLPTYATPNIGGGYTLQQPGQPPTYLRPQ